MTRTVRAGKQRFKPAIFGFVFSRSIAYQVTFNRTAQYNHGTADQDDWNKLFGIAPISVRSILEQLVSLLKWIKPSWFKWLKAPHHKNSHRFVWRYNLQQGRVEIGMYSYIDGERTHKVIGYARSYYPQYLELYQNGENVVFRISFIEHTVPGKLPRVGWKLGAFFGGDRAAPHDIEIHMKKYRHDKT